jgi:hypothetical protein
MNFTLLWKIRTTLIDYSLKSSLFKENIAGASQDGSQFCFKWNTGFQSKPMVVYKNFVRNLDSSWTLNSSQLGNGLNTFEFVIEFTVLKVAHKADD